MSDLDQSAVLRWLGTAYHHYCAMYDAATDPVERQVFGSMFGLVMAIGMEIESDRFVVYNFGPFGAWRSVIGKICEIEARCLAWLDADWGEEECIKDEEIFYQSANAQGLVEAAGSDAARWSVI